MYAKIFHFPAKIFTLCYLFSLNCKITFDTPTYIVLNIRTVPNVRDDLVTRKLLCRISSAVTVSAVVVQAFGC